MEIFKLSSANVFNLDQSKNMTLGKGLKEERTMWETENPGN